MRTRFAAVAALGMMVLCFPSMGATQSEQEGIAAFNEGKELYEKAAPLSDTSGRESGLNKALERYRRALTIFEKNRSEKWQADTLEKIGFTYISLQKQQNALEYLEKAQHMYGRLGDVKSQTELMGPLAWTYQGMGQERKGRELLARGVLIAGKSGDRKAEADVRVTAARYLGVGKAPKFKEQTQHYEKAIVILHQIGDFKTEAEILTELGWLHFNYKDVEKANRCFERSVNSHRQAGDVKGEAKSINDLASVCVQKGLYDKALQWYEQSLRLSGKIGDVDAQIDVITQMAGVYEIVDASKARQYRQKALELAAKHAKPEKEAAMIDERAMTLLKVGQYRAALDQFHQALEIQTRTGNKSPSYTTLTAMAMCYSSIGHYRKALEYTENALEALRKDGFWAQEALQLSAVATLYEHLGNDEKAIEYHEKALESRKKADTGTSYDQEYGLTLMAALYERTGRHRLAIDCYEKQYRLAEQDYDAGRADPHPSLQHISLLKQRRAIILMGQAYERLGLYDKALARYEQALELSRKAASSPEDIQLMIGTLYLDMNQPAKAEPWIKKAGADLALGRLYLAKGDHRKAKEHYRRAVESAEKEGQPGDLFEACTGAGLACETMGDYSGAAEYFRKAVDLTEELRSLLTPAQREHFLAGKEGAYARTTPYEGLARVLLKLNKAPEAFKVSEYTKARLFSEAVSKSTQTQRFDVPAPVLQADREIMDGIAALKSKRREELEKGNTLVLDGIDALLRDLGAGRAAHMKMIREKYPLFAATKYPAPMGLDQTKLRDDEWVLAYHVTDKAVIVYLTKGKKLVKALQKEVSRTRVNELVRAFRDCMESKEEGVTTRFLQGFDFRAGKRLADVLLSDVLPELPPGTPLTVVPDDCLEVLPFEMLVLDDRGKVVTGRGRPKVEGAQFFGDRNSISYYQSVTALTLVRTLAHQRHVGTRTLVMYDPVFDTDDFRLKALAGSERERLCKYLPIKLMTSIKDEIGVAWPRLELTSELGRALVELDPMNTRAYSGLKAEKSVLFAGPLTQFRQVVFATHGYAARNLPGIGEPVLVLTLVGQPEGRDGFLRLSEVMGLRLNADIVALTACQSALGKRLSGEGTMGMGRAFQYAGSQAVLMSLWSVAESSSVLLVERFFRHLRAGMNKLAALQLARKEIREQGYDHPFFWAPFILVGEAGASAATPASASRTRLEARSPGNPSQTSRATEAPDEWKISLSIEGDTRLCRIGSEIAFMVSAERDCHVYVVSTGTDGSSRLIFPNRFQASSTAKKDTPFRVPQKESPLLLRVSAPEGINYVRAFACLKPVEVLEQSRGLEVDLKHIESEFARAAPGSWSRSQVSLTIRR
ncbi:MAG: CHAT domain-containing protein [Thermodesulfobacteriota bacterium]